MQVGYCDRIGGDDLQVADMNADGDIDIVGANWELSSPAGGRLNWWRNDAL